MFGNFTRKMNFNLDEYLREFFSPPFQIELESRKLLNPHIKEHHPEKGGCCIECEEFMSVSINDLSLQILPFISL